MLRAAGLPYLCSPESGVAKYTYDCSDVEQTADDLVVCIVLCQLLYFLGRVVWYLYLVACFMTALIGLVRVRVRD